LRGTVSGVVARFADREVKGEITIVVRGSTDGCQVSEAEVNAEIRRLGAAGMGVKEISQLLGERYQLSKREVYQIVLKLKSSKGSS
jgi:16S rRNA C1402 (ribose-2'-O) methylase RsmI